MPRNAFLLSWGLAILVLVGLATPVAEAVAPHGKHYAGMLVLVDPETGEIDAAPTCMSFVGAEICTELGDCGAWRLTDRLRRQNEWSFEIEFLNGDGQLIKAKGKGLTERGGLTSSIAGTVLFELGGVEMNASFAAVRMSKSRCLAFGLQDD